MSWPREHLDDVEGWTHNKGCGLLNDLLVLEVGWSQKQGYSII